MMTMTVAPESTSCSFSPRGVQRIDVDDDQPGAQHREERDRIRDEVRQHDGDAFARPAFRLLNEESCKGAADAFPLSVAHARVQAFERRAGGVAHAGIEQHGRKRRIGIRIDILGHAGRIRREPDRVGRARGALRRRTLRLECHGDRSSAGALAAPERRVANRRRGRASVGNVEQNVDAAESRSARGAGARPPP